MASPERPSGRETNRLRDALASGRLATVLASAAMTSDLVDLLGQTRGDGVWLEAESGPLTWDQLGDLTRAADLWHLGTLVRIPAFEPWRVGRALSLGAHGVVLPQVSGVDEAEAFVAAARFSPHGTRGVTRGRRSYGRPDFFASEALSPITVVQVESVEVLEELDALCRIPTLDVVFIAPNDLADSMGHLGDPGHPDVREQIDRGLATIAAAGKVAGTSATPDRVDELRRAGARLLYLSIDQWLLAAADEILPR